MTPGVIKLRLRAQANAKQILARVAMWSFSRALIYTPIYMVCCIANSPSSILAKAL